MLINDILSSVEEIEEIQFFLNNFKDANCDIEINYLNIEISNYLKLLKLFSLTSNNNDNVLNIMKENILKDLEYIENKHDDFVLKNNNKIHEKPLFFLSFNIKKISQKNIQEYKRKIRYQLNFINKEFSDNLEALNIKKDLRKIENKLNKLSNNNIDVYIPNIFNKNILKKYNIVDNEIKIDSKDLNLIEEIYLVQKRFTFMN